MAKFTLTEVGPRGEPRQLRCGEHPDCGWRRDLAGPMGPHDPIVQALFGLHLREQAAATPSMMGHPKRARIAGR